MLPTLFMAVAGIPVVVASQTPQVTADQVGAPDPGKAVIHLMRTNQMVNKAVLDESTLDGMSWAPCPPAAAVGDCGQRRRSCSFGSIHRRTMYNASMYFGQGSRIPRGAGR
jgi:hypothetical protein